MLIHYSKYLIFLFVWLFGLLSVGAIAIETEGWDVLYREASKKQMAQHPYWLRLLHYHHPGESPGQWSSRSDIQSRSFFLSSQGHMDPEAELQATLQSFFSKKTEDPNQHPQCRFIARLEWLKTQLDFSKVMLPKRNCPLVERWANLSYVKSISVVFASAYMGNPASIYGHILLKFNLEGNIFGHFLLSPTFNFGALVRSEDSPITYAFKGLFGGYVGRFSDERFYNYNHVYGETELRDLWEYVLNFDEQQRRRIIYHTWELLQLVDFEYYFFLDNCAYRMAELLEMAWDEEKVNPTFALWIIPLNVFYRLEEIENNGKPLVQSIRLIPSRQRRLQQKMALLNTVQKDWFSKIINDVPLMHSSSFAHVPDVERAQILDTLIDYNQYLLSKDDTLLSPQQKQKLLLLRSQLPIVSYKKNRIASPAPPTAGSPTTRFRMGAVYNSTQDNSLELGAWTSFHDLLGREAGHVPNTNLTTLDLRIRINDKGVHLHRFNFFDLQSLEISPVDSPLPSAWSWQVKGSLEPRDLKCHNCPVWNITGGMGKAYAFPTWPGNYFAFATAFLKVADRFEQDYAAGIGSSAGMILTPTDLWKFGLRWNYLGARTKEHFTENQVQWHHRFTLSKQWDMRLEVDHHQATEAGVVLNYYW
ncbi:MAG: DUF4105 domain-containing protein [SAR324 cluster bacterium]|nr:DUF4105 domain-containing protein [SAR324 cluster bacterium]